MSCHVAIHRKVNLTKEQYKFNDNRDLVPITAPLIKFYIGEPGDRRSGL